MSLPLGDSDANLAPVRTVSNVGCGAPGSNRITMELFQSWASARWSS